MPMLTEDPRVEVTRAGIHERIQAQMYHRCKEAEVMAEEQLEALT